jgi:cation diffusion facilitator CzcD-associated flavoprotein CzcO
MSDAHYDILIIGAGLSGVGMACQIAKEFPEKRMALLERRERIGGTWDLFRYPGIRSDTDMCSYSYDFRPWKKLNVLAEGHDLRRYIETTAEEFGINDKVHFGLKINEADWSSEQRHWKVTALREASGETREYTCDYLIGCTGYYNHDEGYRPNFPGEKDYKGSIIHPQFWPEDLDYSGKKVVVIGSGATAVTLIPSMADKAGHITMLQRSPSYVYSLPALDKLTGALAHIIPEAWAYKIARKRNIYLQRMAFLACKRWPNAARRYFLSHVRKQVGPNVDMRHFTPAYMPWDERVAAVPDSDLFRALREGKCSVETDHIDRFTEKGILLKSGKELEADIIITATGLKLQMLGGMEVRVDGKIRPVNRQMTYKGVLLEDLPNMAWIIGYTNTSWTLKLGIAARYLCRLFKYMEKNDFQVVVPCDDEKNRLDNEGILDSLKAGYIKRDGNQLPRQGKASPWRMSMHYGQDKKMLLDDNVGDSRLQFMLQS